LLRAASWGECLSGFFVKTHHLSLQRGSRNGDRIALDSRTTDTNRREGTVMAEKVHVLVVDDEAEVRDLLQEYLSGQDYDVSTAESIPAARAVLDAATNSNPVELVVLDLKMPGENGLVLARELRDRGGVAVIMLTASGETIDRIVGLEVGADD
jgi:CheY-like chemotaxis protein